MTVPPSAASRALPALTAGVPLRLTRTPPLARVAAVVGTGVLALLATAVYRGPLAALVTGWEWPDRPHGALVTALAWSVILAPACLLRLDAARPSRPLAWVLHLGVLLPAAVVAQWAPMPDAQVVGMLLAMTAGFAVVAGVGLLPPLRLPQPALTPHTALLVWLLLAGVCTALLLRTWGDLLHLAAPSEVYAQRARWMARDAGLLAGYAQSWLVHALVPFGVAAACLSRRWWPAVLALLLATFAYAIAAQRIALAAPLLAAGAWWLASRAPRRLALAGLAGAVGAFALPFLLGPASPVAAGVAELVLYRGVLNNGFLATLYFDFFATRPPVGFAAVKGLALLGGDAAQRDYKAQLGWHWFGTETDPNASFLADGFAQLGVAGVLVEALLVAAALWLLDSIAHTRKLPAAFVLAAMAAHVVTLTNGQAPNLLLGGGLLCSLGLLWLWPAATSAHTDHAP